MAIACDPDKRRWTIVNRAIDLMQADTVFAGRTLTLEDDRRDYGEPRFQTYGMLASRLVMIVWTARGENRHVISMRHCHADETRKVVPRLAGSDV